MATQFVCNQCQPMQILSESGIKPHISARHMHYFPFQCATCQAANQMYLALTKENMDQHISSNHSGNSLGILQLEDPAKEVELNKMVEQCSSWPPQPFPLNDSKRELRRALHLPDTSADGSDDDVMIIERDIVTAAMPNNTLDDNLPEQAAQVHAERIAKIENDESAGHTVASSITNNKVLSTKNNKMESNESNEQSAACPITENSPNCENNGVPNTVLPKRELAVKISTAPEPYNFTESYPELHFLSQSTSGRKRELPDNFSDNDSFQSTEKRRLMMNGEHLESGGHCSRDVNCGSANRPSQYVKPALMNATVSQRKDSVERPTTSSQVTSSVLPDSSCKHTITKLFIVISEGIVFFETSDRTKYKYAPLSERVKILRESVLAKDSDVVIQFYAHDDTISYDYQKSDEPTKKFTSLEQLEIFARQMREITFLWSSSLISAHFSRFKEKTLTQSDYCAVLFGPEQSILKSGGLFILLAENWPFSIVTNVANQCDRCELELEETLPGNQTFHNDFLDELYDGQVLQRIDKISFSIKHKTTADDFIVKLQKRFQALPHKRFKFGLFSPSQKGHNRKYKKGDHILVVKSVIKQKKNYSGKSVSSWAIIEQRAAGS